MFCQNSHEPRILRLDLTIWEGIRSASVLRSSESEFNRSTILFEFFLKINIKWEVAVLKYSTVLPVKEMN